MIRIAVTGTIGSGKSTVSKILSDSGVPVVSADDIVSSLRSPGNIVWQEIRKRWPGKYIGAGRKVDISKLRADTLNNPDFREELEGIIHPLVKSETEKILSVWEKEGLQLGAAEVPLLYEAGWEDIFDVVITTWAPQKILIKRVNKKFNTDRDESLKWLSLQLDQNEKKERSDYTVNTAGKIKKTRKDIKKIIKKIKEKKR